jgi:hypothetical protein
MTPYKKMFIKLLMPWFWYIIAIGIIAEFIIELIKMFKRLAG